MESKERSMVYSTVVVYNNLEVFVSCAHEKNVGGCDLPSNASVEKMTAKSAYVLYDFIYIYIYVHTYICTITYVL